MNRDLGLLQRELWKVDPDLEVSVEKTKISNIAKNLGTGKFEVQLIKDG